MIEKIIDLSQQAGEAVLDIYNSGDFDSQTKIDHTPVTKADIEANKIIEAGLERISELPIISEEGNHNAGSAEEFWLVDPLDGTKEFIKKTGEFTVNIALIKDGEPVLGVVYAPVSDTTYVGQKDGGAFKVQNGKKQPIKAVFGNEKPKVVASRSHSDESGKDLLKKLGKYDLIKLGSSIKFCMVAEGTAMVYPRLLRSYGWDTAAGHAVVTAAGGHVTELNGQPLKYTTEIKKNPFLIVQTSDSKLL